MMTKTTSEYLVEQCANMADAAQKLAEQFAMGNSGGSATLPETVERGAARIAAALDIER